MRRRHPTQCVDPWPFLFSAVPGRGLVINVRKPRKRIRLKERHRIIIITKKGKP